MQRFQSPGWCDNFCPKIAFLELTMILTNKRQIARHYGVTVRSIERWIARGLPLLSDGCADSDEIDVWRQTKGPAQELKARPVELAFLSQPIPEDVIMLFTAGVAEFRRGLKTLTRGLVVGQYPSPEVRRIILKILVNLIMEVSDG
jgi:hypothetical protein